ELSFLIETGDFPSVVAKTERYGGKTALLSVAEKSATFKLSSGILLTLQTTTRNKWGVSLIMSTGSEDHLEKLRNAGFDSEEFEKSKHPYPAERAVYRKLGLSFIEPELREGYDEVERAANGKLPALVSADDIRGELHAHSTSSDGANTIEQMAAAARNKGYEYIGISDHSQSLKIAGGVSEGDLWNQIRFIDQLKGKLSG